MKILVALLFASLALLGVFILGNTRKPIVGVTDSGAYGTVSYRPVCPVEPCSVAPVYDFNVVAKDGSGRVAGKQRPDSSGLFKIALPPGTYTITTDKQIGIQKTTSSPVLVAAHHFTEVNLNYDTGIR